MIVGFSLKGLELNKLGRRRTFQAEEKLVPKYQGLRDYVMVMRHGDCQGLRLERKEEIEDAGFGNLGKDSGLTPRLHVVPKEFQKHQKGRLSIPLFTEQK